MTKMRDNLYDLVDDISRSGRDECRHLLQQLVAECQEDTNDLARKVSTKDGIIHMKDDRIDGLIAKQNRLTDMWQSRVANLEGRRKQEKAAYKKLSQTCSRKDAANTELNARLAEQIRANRILQKAAAEPAVEIEWSAKDMAADNIVQRQGERILTLEGALKVERSITLKKTARIQGLVCEVQEQKGTIGEYAKALVNEREISRERGQAIEDLRTKLREAEDETALKREKSMLAQWCVDKNRVLRDQRERMNLMREQVEIMDGAQVEMTEAFEGLKTECRKWRIEAENWKEEAERLNKVAIANDARIKEAEQMKDTVQRGRDSLKARAQEIERLYKRCHAKDTNIEHLRFLLRNASDEVGRLRAEVHRCRLEPWRPEPEGGE